jgi:hypothetical protein
LIRSPADIYWIAARSNTLIALNDGYLVSRPPEQRRQRRTSDSGA